MRKPKDFEDETKLLQLLARGSEKAFAQVFDRYQSRVFGVAYELLKSREHAKEIVQEVFLRVWTRRIAFMDVQNLEAFIYTMAKNLTLNYLRKLAAEHIAQYKFTTQRNNIDNSTEFPLIDQQLEDLLNKTIEKLPPQQREVYHLARVEGLTHEAIATRLHISPHTVRNHMVSALKFIKVTLEPHTATSVFLPVVLSILK
jgi:RNA polymerase sigma-70 factor (ECF subfamily)